MSRMRSNGSYYEIDRFLGEGLTSQVYKAFRRDNRGYTKQPVALKLVKSKKHVQILRKEFEKLQKVDSQNCVKVYGWENLEKGPALVLELLEGVSLHELQQKFVLQKEIIDEILAQLQNGIKAIHKKDLVHGDLNLKNVFISPEGIVKLLDFGVLHGSSEMLGTPQFLAPEVWQGESYTGSSDLFSLGLIREFLLKPTDQPLIHAGNWKKNLQALSHQNALLAWNSSKREFLNISSSAELRKELGNKVRLCMEFKNQSKTSILLSQPRKKKRIKKYGIFLCMTVLLSLIPSFPKVPAWSRLEIRSHYWVALSINSLPPEFTSIASQRLRPGMYEIYWENDRRKWKKKINLKPEGTFILKPEPIKL